MVAALRRVPVTRRPGVGHDGAVRWLVDGMNVMGTRPDGWWRDRAAARQRIVGELAGFARRDGVDRVTVVFDGRTVPDEIIAGAAAGVEVAFAPGGPDAADRVIAAMAREADDPSALTVVTSDGALAGAARDAGATVMGAGTFRRLLDEARPR